MQTEPQKVKHILLVGNPNVGKSTIFNLLCNKNQKKNKNFDGILQDHFWPKFPVYSLYGPCAGGGVHIRGHRKKSRQKL